MRNKSIFLKIMAVCLFVVMLMSFAACNNNKNNSTPDPNQDNKTEGEGLTPKNNIKALADLVNYSSSATYYNLDSTKKTFSGSTYDGQDCSAQLTKLQNRIDSKTNDVYTGESDSAAIKIFTKSTPQGIMEAIAKAGLTFDEMKRVVNYMAGEEDASVSDYIAKVTDESGKITGWTGSLTLKGTTLTEWLDAGSDGKDLNDGWSFFDDWELYDRLKDYAKKDNKATTGLKEGVGLNGIGTMDTAADNASWQQRSILQKVYEDVDLDGAPASRLITYMLEYAITISEGMAGSGASISSVAKSGDSFDAYSTYFRTKAPVKPTNLSSDPEIAKTQWIQDPYSSLGDYDTLVYLLAFNDLYKVKGYGSSLGAGIVSCVQLYGFYYQYNETYYNVVLKDRETYKKQLHYEKLDTFSDTDWLDYVSIQRQNYTGSYRYSAAFYQVFYDVHFDFQARKESKESFVYDFSINDVTNGRTYTQEMKKAIISSKGGIPGQLAMSDWTWCYGGDEAKMKAYNAGNTAYQTNKDSKKDDEKYQGQYKYEVQELYFAEYLIRNMTNDELTGAIYYNTYAYSGSLTNEIVGYEKQMISIDNGMKGGDEYTTIATGIIDADKDSYAIGKLDVLQAQAAADWTNADVEKKANKTNHDWATMRTEMKEALPENFNYMSEDKVPQSTTGEYAGKIWQKRCDYLEDRVIAKEYSCCHQRVSEADINKCTGKQHGVLDADGKAVTKDYKTDRAISQFVSEYEDILYYIATKAKVEMQTPTGNGYDVKNSVAKTYTTGYNGTVASELFTEISATSGKKMSYDTAKEFTMNLGKTFAEDVLEDAEDKQWWDDNSVGSTAAKKDIDFGPKDITEELGGNNDPTFTYTYTFAGWYLDEKCQYEFSKDDNVDFSIRVYAGYNVTKALKQ